MPGKDCEEARVKVTDLASLPDDKGNLVMCMMCLKPGTLIFALVLGLAIVSGFTSPLLNAHVYGGEKKGITQKQSDAQSPTTDSQASRPIPLARLTAEDACHAALEKVDDFNFDQSPLSDVMSYLETRLKINVVIDVISLKTANIDPNDQMVSLKLKQVPVSAFLRQMLDSFGLGYEVRNGALLIADKESLASRRTVRVYPISDLILEEAGEEISDISQDFIDLITRTIDPDAWEDNGGDGRIEYMSRAYSLVVTQSFEIHEKIERLIQALREASVRSEKSILTTKKITAKEVNARVDASIAKSQARIAALHQSNSESEDDEQTIPFKGAVLVVEYRNNDVEYTSIMQEFKLRSVGDRKFIVGTILSGEQLDWRQGRKMWIALEDVVGYTEFDNVDQYKKANKSHESK